MSTPFRSRNPVIIGAISLAVIAGLMTLAFKAGDLPVIEVYEGGVGPKDTPEADYAEAMLLNARTLADALEG